MHAHLRHLSIDSAFIDAEDIVAKLHFLDQMESRWPYDPGKSVPLHKRVTEALAQLPEEFQKYALAAFANVIYVPHPILRESWKYLASDVAQSLGISVGELFSNSHLLEVDPSGLMADVLHENHIHGRLDSDRFSRLNSVDALADHLRTFAFTPDVQEHEIRAIKLAFSKKYWLLLSDNVLSGTSMLSDLNRCSRLLSAYAALGQPELIPVAQVLTESALQIFTGDHQPFHAIWLDSRSKFVPGNEDCHLFNQSDTLSGVLQLSEWLASQEWFAGDERLTATIAKSGDSMAYGFKRGGWTIVTPNAPTNSLPILWYACEGAYTAPFPRVMSRTSQAKGAGAEATAQAVEVAKTVLEKIRPA